VLTQPYPHAVGTGFTPRGPAGWRTQRTPFGLYVGGLLEGVKRSIPLSTSPQLCLTQVIITEGKAIMLARVEETTTIGVFAGASLVHTPTITTLYALIEAVQDQVVTEDDAAVTATVARLCNAGYVKFLNISEDREIAGTH
jgi:hypothetical protein